MLICHSDAHRLHFLAFASASRALYQIQAFARTMDSELWLPGFVQRFRPRLLCDLFYCCLISSLALPCFRGVYTGYPPCVIVFVTYVCEVLEEKSYKTAPMNVCRSLVCSEVFTNLRPLCMAHVNQLSNKQWILKLNQKIWLNCD